MTPTRRELVIHVAGRGENCNGPGAWIPVDAAGEVGRLLVSTVRDYRELIRARHIFVVVDAFLRRFFESTRGPLPSGPAPAEDIPSRYALTAGWEQRGPDGAAGGNSPFADAFEFQLATATRSSRSASRVAAS